MLLALISAGVARLFKNGLAFRKRAPAGWALRQNSPLSEAFPRKASLENLAAESMAGRWEMQPWFFAYFLIKQKVREKDFSNKYEESNPNNRRRKVYKWMSL